MKAAILVLAALALLPHSSEATPASGCTANVVETMQSSTSPTVVLPVLNKHACVLNWLQQRAVRTMTMEVVCAPGITSVPAAGRVLFTLTPTVALDGDEAVDVEVFDGSGLGVFTYSLAGLPGPDVKVWVFNHDALQSRIPEVCATIGRQ